MATSMRLKNLIAKFLQWCEKCRKPNTTDGYRYSLRKFLRHAGNKPINKLLPVDLETYARTWHDVQSVQRLFQWAKDSLRLVKENIFAKVPRPPAGQRNRILDPRELARYLRKTRNRFRDFLFAMRETLARPQEIRALYWTMLQSEVPRLSIDEALAAGRAIFVMRDYKSRERRNDPNAPRIILVSRRLGRLLLRLRTRATSLDGPVFLNSLRKAWTGNSVRCRMRRLRKKFNLPADDGKENVVAYSLRHSMATYAIARGVNLKIVSELLGHTDIKTTMRYLHMQVEHLRKGIDQIEGKEDAAARRAEQRRKAA